MFFSKNKGNVKSEDMKILEEKNRLMELQLLEMERKFSLLQTKQEESKAPNKSESAIKEVYEDQLQQVLQKKLELEDKMKRMDKMMSEMEEMERKSKEAHNVPPAPVAPNNPQPTSWMPPTTPTFYGNGPQSVGPMPFSGHPQGYPGHPPGMYGGPMGPYHQPMNMMPAPPHQNMPYLPGGPQMPFRQPHPTPDMNNQDRQGTGGPRFNKRQDNQGYNRNLQQRNNANENEGGGQRYEKFSQNRNDNKTSRPLFLNPEERSKSRQSEEDKNGEVDRKEQERFGNYWRSRGRGNYHGRNSIDRQKHHMGPDHHDRRTNMKRSSRGRPQDHRPRNMENAETIDSDDLSDTSSSSSSDEETPKVEATSGSLPSINAASVQAVLNSNMPDIVKVNQKKNKKSSVPNKEDAENKEVISTNKKKRKNKKGNVEDSENNKGGNVGEAAGTGTKKENKKGGTEVTDANKKKENKKGGTEVTDANKKKENIKGGTEVTDANKKKENKTGGIEVTDANKKKENKKGGTEVTAANKKKENKKGGTEVTDANKKKENKKGGATPKKTANIKDEMFANGDEPLSKNNLGPNDVLKKFVGTSIPSLLEGLNLNIDLNRKVTGIILMSDPSEVQPILETPKTLIQIIHFKMQYPNAKSILL